MRRRLFNLAGATSLVLFLAVLSIDIRSYWVVSRIELSRVKWLTEHHRQTIMLNAHADAGYWMVEVGTRKVQFPADEDTKPYHLAVPDQILRRFWNGATPTTEWRPYKLSSLHFLGFAYDTSTEQRGIFNVGPEFWTDVSIPIWASLLAFSVLPVLWARSAYRRSDKRKPGHCRTCGYNLTANTTGVCPECGTRASARSRVL